jgi:Coenzyme PQQ synthesis protein D (PqqD)
MYHTAEHVRSVADSDGTTLLDLKANLILALNKTGAMIWEGIQGGNSLDMIVDRLAEASGTERGCIEKDAHEFVSDLAQRGLLSQEA